MTVSRIRSLRAAAAFVDRVGIAVLFPADASVLPSLWQAVTGTRELTVFTTDERGKNVLTPELDRVWALQSRLAETRLACVGKHLHSRIVLLSPAVLPLLYAQTGRQGCPDDFRQLGAYSRLETELAEALFEEGPRTARHLRRLVGVRSATATKRALEALQRSLVVTQTGEVEQDRSWAAAAFDLVARRYADRLETLTDSATARLKLAALILRTAGELSAADLCAAVRISRSDASSALDALVDQGRARRRQESRFVLWTPV